MSFPIKLVAKINKTHSLYLATILFFATFIVYANTLGNGLFFDDEHFIYNNPQVIHFSLPNLFTQSLTPPTGQPTNYYRPLLFLTFGAEYAVFKDTAFIYHLDNLLLHGAVGLLLYALILTLFKNKALAFLTALFFLISPVQTEAISYANSRGDSLSFLFILLSLYLSLQKKPKYYFFSLLSFLCALLSKEIAITTPLLFVLVHTFAKEKLSLEGFLNSVKKSIPFFVILFVYIFLRLTILNFNNTLNFWGYETLYTQNIFVRLNTFLNVLPLYISLLLLPLNLFMERDATISISKSITPITFEMMFFLIALFILFWKIKKTYPIFLFSLLWFCISFGPMSGIIPISGIFYEHFLYIPSVGFFLILSFCILWILSRSKPSISIIIFLSLIAYLFFLSFRTIVRNSEWNNPISFYTQTLSFAKTARVYNNLAMTYANAGDFNKAIPLYEKSIILSNTYAETYYNLGNAYLELKNYTEAEKSYKKSLQINKWFTYPYTKLYYLYVETNDQKGLREITKALEELGKQNKEYLYFLEELKNSKN